MKLIVGLGNPGKKYENNRHNVGYMMIDLIVDQIKNYPFDNTQDFGGERFGPELTDEGLSRTGRLQQSRTDEKLKIKSYNLKFKIDKYLQSEILRLDLNKKSILFIKPRTFMNKSGLTVKSCVTRYALNVTRDLFIVHDDLDLHLGDYKIQRGKGPRLHRGILSIEKELATTDFWRIRIGVDNREPDSEISGENYVLQGFEGEERRILKGAFEEIYTKLIDRLS